MSMNPVALKIATPYARTLYTIAKENHCQQKVGRDLKIVSNFLESNDSRAVKKCMNNPLFDSELKYNIISVIFKKVKGRKLDAITAEFITFLINRKRINIFAEVNYKYQQLLDAETRSIDVIITTVYDINPIKLVTYSSMLKRIMKFNQVRLYNEKDESLIAGLSLKTESKILDFSIKNQLQKLAKHLNATLEI